jgi:hypothetical protein
VRRSDGTIEDCWHLLSDISNADPFTAPELLRAKVVRAVDGSVDLRDQSSAGVQVMTKSVQLDELIELNPPE